MTHHRHLRATATAAATAISVLAAAGCGTTSSSSPGAAPPATGGSGSGSGSIVAAAAGPPARAKVGSLGPSGTFRTLDGGEVNVSSYRGTPTLLWFVAAGCSSCVASIPALAKHLPELRADGVHVVVVDLFGDLDPGARGAADLRKLGIGLTGNTFTDPAWTWGTSSKTLSFAYDKYGEPDIYYVLDRTGKVTFQSGVPVTTMNQLLAHAHAASQG